MFNPFHLCKNYKLLKIRLRDLIPFKLKVNASKSYLSDKLKFLTTLSKYSYDFS